MIAERSAIRCVDFTTHLFSLQCWALPRPVPRREGRETATAVSYTKGFSVSLRQELPGRSASSVLSLDSVPAPFINPLYDVVLSASFLQIQAFHSKVTLPHISLSCRVGFFRSSVSPTMTMADLSLLLPL